MGDAFSPPVPTTTMLQDLGGQVFHAKAYGAIGNGTVDDTAAIQAAINAAKATGSGRVFLAAGSYKLTQTLTLGDGGGVFGISLVGAGANNTILQWVGATSGYAITVNKQAHFLLEGFSLVSTVGSGPSGIGVASTDGTEIHHGRFQDLLIQGFNNGLDLGQANNPVSRSLLSNCRFVQCASTGVSLINCQDVTFLAPEFNTCGFGVASVSSGANFAIFGGYSKGQTAGDVHIGSGGYCLIAGHHSAGSRRFLDASIGTSLCTIKLAGCIVEASTNADGISVQASGNFALTLESCKVFGDGTHHPVSVTAAAGTGNAAGSSLCMIGCGILDTVPFNNVSGTLQYMIAGCQQLGANFTVVGQFPNRVLPAWTSP
jgi:hypothetical protein